MCNWKIQVSLWSIHIKSHFENNNFICWRTGKIWEKNKTEVDESSDQGGWGEEDEEEPAVVQSVVCWPGGLVAESAEDAGRSSNAGHVAHGTEDAGAGQPGSGDHGVQHVHHLVTILMLSGVKCQVEHNTRTLGLAFGNIGKLTKTLQLF